MRIAVLGLGEAGSIYASDLAGTGEVVTAVDPNAGEIPRGVVRAATIADAVDGADLVLSLVGAGAAEHVLDDALPAMTTTAIFADLNTAAPAAERAWGVRAAASGVGFADVGVLAPVPRKRLATPLIVSGDRGERLVEMLTQLGIPATLVGGEAGDASCLRMVRSVFMKGLAALVFETAEAAEHVGAREWALEQVAAELGTGGEALVERMLTGTARHAVRREAEMQDVQKLLETYGARHPMTDSTIDWLQTIANRTPHESS
ncbi:NAD(P)-dependent oxidoreductase [Paramicrobacterium fandaimingii]|uniref:NAD(P)-dependent oxidoreductase n=1 Tax=Paramicrobacterium fandaimingii TaxID=2708079 RepID=UPI001424437B|nr:NAD(P)-binding domain-containing protein [Microbacterium fandaimingii]